MLSWAGNHFIFIFLIWIGLNIEFVHNSSLDVPPLGAQCVCVCVCLCVHVFVCVCVCV